MSKIFFQKADKKKLNETSFSINRSNLYFFHFMFLPFSEYIKHMSAMPAQAVAASNGASALANKGIYRHPYRRLEQIVLISLQL